MTTIVIYRNSERIGELDCYDLRLDTSDAALRALFDQARTKGMTVRTRAEIVQDRHGITIGEGVAVHKLTNHPSDVDEFRHLLEREGYSIKFQNAP